MYISSFLLREICSINLKTTANRKAKPDSVLDADVPPGIRILKQERGLKEARHREEGGAGRAATARRKRAGDEGRQETDREPDESNQTSHFYGTARVFGENRGQTSHSGARAPGAKDRVRETAQWIQRIRNSTTTSIGC